MRIGLTDAKHVANGRRIDGVDELVEIPEELHVDYEAYYKHDGTIQLDGHYTPLQLRRIADWVDAQLRLVNPRMSTVPTPGVLVNPDEDARAVVLGRLLLGTDTEYTG